MKVLVVSREGSRLLEPPGRMGALSPRVVSDWDDAQRSLERSGVDVLLASDDVPNRPPAAMLRRLARGAAFLLSAGDGVDIEPRSGIDAILPRVAPPRARDEILRLAACLTNTRRKAANLARRLRQSEARFRDVILRNADAILVIDRHGVIQFANPSAAELFGRNGHELIGTHFGYPLVAGETTELDLIGIERSVVVEMRVVESHWEGRHACVATLRDITERRKAEDDARRLIREQLARSAAEAAAARSTFLAESSTILASSLERPAILSSLARLCVVDLAEWAVVIGFDAQAGAPHVAAASRTGDHRVTEMRDRMASESSMRPRVREVVEGGEPVVIRPEHGESGWMPGPESLDEDDTLLAELRLVVPVAIQGSSFGAMLLGTSTEEWPGSADVAIAVDLAARAALALENARLYEAAQKAIQEKTDYLAVISHDLRTPLNSIIGHSDLLSMGIPDPLSEAGRLRVDRIRTSASHLVNLIDELIALARFDAGHEEVNLTVVDAGEMVREVCAVVELLALERGLSLRLDAHPERLLLRTDEDKLRQVLVNLVGNAIKYTDRGEVRVRLEPAEGGVTFHVEDTGIGIAREHLDSIFKPFWQVDGTRRGNGGGTGLGLSVVRRLIRLLGGEVTVRSQVGRGSAFAVTLPIEAPVEAAGEAAGTPSGGE